MRPKVLIYQEQLSSYNIPLYEELGRAYDLSLLISEPTDYRPKGFEILYSTKYSMLGFFYTSNATFSVLNNYNVVILTFNLRWINLLLYSFFKNLVKPKFILWGIGVSASYTKVYDKDKTLDFYRRYLLLKFDAAIFYSFYPVRKYVEKKILRSKLFCANNTVFVKQVDYSDVQRDNIIFVGTLYKQKGFDDLLSVYLIGKNRSMTLPKLEVVGGGENLNSYISFVNENGLSSLITFHGPVYDEDLLSSIFTRAIICVSPKQAGLSVLKSMGNGVPFVTSKNAITGGEIFNIVNGENGIIYEKSEDLLVILSNLLTKKDVYLEMGRNALNYYNENATIDIMKMGFSDAIGYVLK